MVVDCILILQARSTTHEPATATVVVSINDTNDNAPFFPNNHYTGAVLENSLIGSKVIQISAIDLDEVFDIFCNLTYNEKTENLIHQIVRFCSKMHLTCNLIFQLYNF